MSAAELAAARVERAARYAAQQSSQQPPASLPTPPLPAAPDFAESAGEAGEAGEPPLRRRRVSDSGRFAGAGASAAAADVLACIELSGERDRQGTHKITEVDCRLWDSAWRPISSGSRVHTLSAGEGKLRDVRADSDADRLRNVRFLTESARLIHQARSRGESVWVHCTEGINRGPAGLLAYLVMHTDVPTLHDAFAIVKSVRQKARTQSNTFAEELATITRRSGKPLQ